MHEVLEQLISQLRGIWLRRWQAIIVAWIIAVAGWIVVYSLPQRYEASARVYIDTQSILKPLMSGLTVNAPIEQQVNMMTRTLMSRPNMEKLARMTDMDLKAKNPKDMEELISGLVSSVKMAPAGQENLYVITYQNREPELAKKVAQSLLTILVEGSLGSKRKDTDTAKRFIEDQIKSYEQKLVTAESALKDFKQKHLGMMPGQGGDYFAKLAAAQTSLNEATLALREAETRRDQLKRQLSGDDPTLMQDTPSLGGANPELDTRIQDLQKRLDNLRSVYTEQHPDIVGTKRVIAQLEEQKKEQAKLKKPINPSAVGGQNTYFQQLSLSLAEAEAQTASLKARVSEYTSRFNGLRQMATMQPQVEADFVQLNRDYEVNKKNYEQLLSRRESASISEEMESKTEVIDFKVIDPPYVPPTPTFPNRPLFLSLVLLLALGGGVGAAFLISQIRPIITDRAGVADVTEYPILGSVSMVWNEAQTKARRKGMIAWATSIAALVSAYGLVMGIAFITARSA